MDNPEATIRALLKAGRQGHEPS
jgi:hypothetical protein